MWKAEKRRTNITALLYYNTYAMVFNNKKICIKYELIFKNIFANFKLSKVVSFVGNMK